MELAYVAGIIDGEGSICITEDHRVSKKGTSYISFDVEISAYNTSLKLMDWLVDHFGGEFEKKPKNQLTRKPCYRWRIKDNAARIAFLTAIYPNLIVKSDQARLVLEYLALKRISPKERLRICREVQHLNVPHR